MTHRIADWLDGIERRVDSRAMSFRNRRHTAVKLLGYSVGMLIVGVILGAVAF